MKQNFENRNDLSIGIFDSGIGGLSICKEITKLLPNESIIYLADSINTPYGEKSKDEIIDLSIKNTELLLEMGSKIIVVACNTATTNAIQILRDKYDIPFIGIEPAIKPAALLSKSGKIGILATKGTLSSELFLNTTNHFKDKIEIIEKVGEGLVKLIEKGAIEDTKDLLIKYLNPMISKGVDNIVLGCTHYPFLIPIIEQIIPNDVTIIDSGEAVAKQTFNILYAKKMLNQKHIPNSHVFFTNGDVELFSEFLKDIALKTTQVDFRNF